MWENTIDLPGEVHQTEDISIPLSAQTFEVYDPELFLGSLQNSELASTTNCCYEENTHFPTNFPSPDIEKFLGTIDLDSPIATGLTTTAAIDNLSLPFDSPEEVENDMSTSLDFSPPAPFSVPPFHTNQTDKLDISSLQSQIPLTDPIVDGPSQYNPSFISPLIGPPIFGEECLNLIPSNCPFLVPGNPMGPYLPKNLSTGIPGDDYGIFNGSIYMGDDFQGDNGGILFPETLSSIYSTSDQQGNESQDVNGVGADITNLEDTTYKVGKCSVEQRKEKIHRYLKKRNERNFTKKIKYACRKTLADSRPRVRGRFAKTDQDFTPNFTFQQDYTDHHQDGAVKVEEGIIGSSDIFAHISGINSFKFNYSIQSWI